MLLYLVEITNGVAFAFIPGWTWLVGERTFEKTAELAALLRSFCFVRILIASFFQNNSCYSISLSNVASVDMLSNMQYA